MLVAEVSGVLTFVADQNAYGEFRETVDSFLTNLNTKLQGQDGLKIQVVFEINEKLLKVGRAE